MEKESGGKSMLKDLMHAIFKEDVEEDDILEDEEEVVEEVEEPVKPVVKEEDPYVRPQPQPFVEPVVEPTPAPVVEEVAPQPVVEEPKRSSIFNGMDIETISARSPRRHTSTYKFDRSKLNKVQDTSEYQAVISPIFGNLEDEKKEFDKVHDAIKLPKPDEDFTFVQVISPMYGNDLPSAKPVSNIPVYDVPSTLATEPKKTMDLSELLEKKEEKKTTQESLFKNTK